MKNIMWIEEPENYYPEPKTIRNVIRWNIAIIQKIDDVFYGSEQSAYQKDMTKINSAPSMFSCPDANELLIRQKEYMNSLDCRTVAKVESATMHGRGLWIEKRKSSCNYAYMIRKIGLQGLKDLNRWIEYYDRYSSPGRTISSAVDYINSKKPPYLQNYLDAVERASYHPRNIRKHCRDFW